MIAPIKLVLARPREKRVVRCSSSPGVCPERIAVQEEWRNVKESRNGSLRVQQRADANVGRAVRGDRKTSTQTITRVLSPLHKQLLRLEMRPQACVI